jgi:hypothetical protein
MWRDLHAQKERRCVMENLVKLEVSNDVVRPIVEAQIRAAIVAEMSKNPQKLFDAMVMEALQFKVARDGRMSQYSSENNFSWLSIQLANVVREEAKRAVEEMIAENRDKIKNAIKKELQKENNANQLAAAVISGMTHHLKCKYTNHIDIRFESPKSE